MTNSSDSPTIGPFTGKYRFLSNFWRTPVHYEDRTWPTAEHAYQAAKTLDPESKDYILRIPSPGVAKREGRSIPLIPGWDSVKVSIMFDILQAKFSNPEMAQLLLDTGHAKLIEFNTWGDRFWGVNRHMYFGDEGQNLLGMLLMRVRRDLRENPQRHLHQENSP